MKLRRCCAATAILLAGVMSGCSQPQKLAPSAQPYVDQGYKPDLPAFMRGTVYERTDMGNTDPFPVSGYSLVVNLQNTGDNSGIPTVVRDTIIKKMTFAGFGSPNDNTFKDLQPEQVLRDPRVAIVQVIGMLPVGVRRGQKFDIIVKAMPRSHTTSLAHGHLYNTDLRVRGLELPAGAAGTLAYADAGDVMVNPSFALEGVGKTYDGATPAQVAAGLQLGAVMNAGRAAEDRPIFLVLRVPQGSIARTIETRVNVRFPTQEGDRPAAAAEDEGLVHLYVPYAFDGDWRHFVGVVNHLYLNDNPDVALKHTLELMAAAVRPKAPLTDISFCFEALGPAAVPIYAPLMHNPDPEVAFAAARAAVFCGDTDALDALSQIAADSLNPCQLDAVKALGALSAARTVSYRLEPLLGSTNPQVRVEAYRILAAHNNRRIVSTDILGHFKIDIVDYDGPPLIFAARSGEQRIAIFGGNLMVARPIVFAAMQNRLTISSDDLGRSLTLFYREDHADKPVMVKSTPSLAEVLARLAGQTLADEDHLSFSYADVVAILQSMCDQRMVVSGDQNGSLAAAKFILDEPMELTDALAAVNMEGRPQVDATQPAPAAGAATALVAPVPGTPGSSGEVPSFSSPTTGGGNSGADPSPSVPSFGNH